MPGVKGKAPEMVVIVFSLNFLKFKAEISMMCFQRMWEYGWALRRKRKDWDPKVLSKMGKPNLELR
jgi:hypothetical protein